MVVAGDGNIRAAYTAKGFFFKCSSYTPNIHTHHIKSNINIRPIATWRCVASFPLHRHLWNHGNIFLRAQQHLSSFRIQINNHWTTHSHKYQHRLSVCIVHFYLYPKMHITIRLLVSVHNNKVRRTKQEIVYNWKLHVCIGLAYSALWTKCNIEEENCNIVRIRKRRGRRRYDDLNFRCINMFFLPIYVKRCYGKNAEGLFLWFM